MNTEKRHSRLVFDKDEYMITLCEYFDQHRDDEFYSDVVKFIETKFSIENDVRMNTLYRAFHDQHDYMSQLTDIESNYFHFNAYYIDKYGDKALKNFGPGFYTLGEINKRVASILKYRISLHHSRDTCKCAKLGISFNELMMLIEFRDTFKHRLMEILNMNEITFDAYFNGTSEHFFVLFFAYFRSIGVKFVLFFSEVYETWIHVYIDENYKQNPFTVLDTTHAY